MFVVVEDPVEPRDVEEFYVEVNKFALVSISVTYLQGSYSCPLLNAIMHIESVTDKS